MNKLNETNQAILEAVKKYLEKCYCIETDFYLGKFLQSIGEDSLCKKFYKQTELFKELKKKGKTYE